MEKKYLFVMEFRAAKKIEEILLWIGKFGSHLLHKLFVSAIVYD